MTQPAHRVVQISVIDWANSLNGKPPIGADLARLIATLAAAVEADRASTHARSSERTEEDRKILRWLGAGSGVGLSSKAIALTALGEMPKEPNYPHDPDDFSRCKALLENIPLARRGLEKLGTDGGPVWAALVARWDEIDAQFEASKAAGWDKDDGKCYRLMQSIIYPVFGWRVPVSSPVTEKTDG